MNDKYKQQRAKRRGHLNFRENGGSLNLVANFQEKITSWQLIPSWRYQVSRNLFWLPIQSVQTTRKDTELSGQVCPGCIIEVLFARRILDFVWGARWTKCQTLKAPVIDYWVFYHSQFVMLHTAHSESLIPHPVKAWGKTILLFV